MFVKFANLCTFLMSGKDNSASIFGQNSIGGVLQSSKVAKLSNESLNNPTEAAKLCTAMRNELLTMLDRLESSLPANTLDQLIDDLGGTENVAEVSILFTHSD